MSQALVVGLLVAVAVFGILAKRLRAPYPVVFVLGGLGIGLVPQTPEIALPPDLVFVLVLPPLLFGGGWVTDWRQFQLLFGPIVQLAVGYVFFATGVIAALAHAIVPALPWSAAFVLGAIVAPPDAVASEAVAEELPLPKTVVAIASGESLLNDASALVVYEFAIAAVVAGTFSFATAILQFFLVVAGGVALGLVVGYVMCRVLIVLNEKRLTDESIDVVISLFTPYLAYLPAQALHVSGVLAAVTAGIYCSRRSAEIFTSQTRIVASAVWGMVFFVVNGGVFIAIGLQLRTILQGLTQYSAPTLVVWALAISAATIVTRFAWIFPVTYLPRLLPGVPGRFGLRELPWTWPFTLSWMGSRGIVSLAAALALPLETASGGAFPQRDLIIFLTYCVILTTLVGQGLTLPALVRALGVTEPEDPQALENQAHIALAEAARDRLIALEPEYQSADDWEVAGRLRAYYEGRIAHFRSHLARGDGLRIHQIDHHLKRVTLAAQRETLARMRASGVVGDDLYRKIAYDIDLEAARLE